VWPINSSEFTAKMNNTDNNSYSVSNSYSYSRNKEDFPSNWHLHKGPFQNTAQTNSEPLQSTTSAVDNRYNMNYNSPSVRQPLPSAEVHEQKTKYLQHFINKHDTIVSN
jgi:hypothetical protein